MTRRSLIERALDDKGIVMAALMKHWDGLRRKDGSAYIEACIDEEGCFDAVRADGLRMRRCVCCLQAFKTVMEAKRIADYCWPVEAPVEASEWH